ncbi:MAG TPA: PQQ-binding-like beta-propeller repeat protein [Tepidisphaeraceae bacterium]|nr:PQQ-binding-like beta-propeller repeat protein [Tepidisphaeraceae bacterium]
MHRPVMESCESRCLLSVSVTTYHNDLSRTGANLQETILTTSNVRASKFGKKHSLQVDGQIYAQPLYVPNLVFQKNGRPVRRNMTYVATQNDTVYAYDADRGSLMWTAALLKRSVGETPVPNSDLGSDDINPVVGITSTPVIDQASDTMYVVAKAKRVTNGVASYVFRLYALDLNTGASKFGGPVTIHAAYPGNGDGSINGFTNFDAKIENQRSGLLLLNGVVYIAFASHGDQGPYHGWLLGV